jgi:hypothetical protein
MFRIQKKTRVCPSAKMFSNVLLLPFAQDLCASHVTLLVELFPHLVSGEPFAHHPGYFMKVCFYACVSFIIISCDSDAPVQAPDATPDHIALYFRTRFEAAEERYIKMKGLVRAALQKVHRIEEENRDLRAAGALAGLELEPLHFNSLLCTFVGRVGDDDDAKESAARLVFELERVKEANVRLSAHNRMLREAGTGPVLVRDEALEEQYRRAITETREYRLTIAALRARISAMEFEWTQAHSLRDELFDSDAKLLELQATLNEMGLKREPANGARVFAVSHRHMLEILVDHRNRHINGCFAMQAVVPFERMRMQKDAEILELRKTIRAMEVATGVCSAEEGVSLSELERKAVEAACKLRAMAADIRAKEAKIDELGTIVRRFEDRAAEWEAAHSEASRVIVKAEKMRAEYNVMVASIRSEEAKLMRRKKAVNAEALHARMCAMMAEIGGRHCDEGEGAADAA